MKTVTLLANQTLLDVAVQEYGDIAAAYLIADENGMPLTTIPDPGTVVRLPDVTIDKGMQTYCKNNRVSPATADTVDGEIKLRIFTEQFTKEFM